MADKEDLTKPLLDKEFDFNQKKAIAKRAHRVSEDENDQEASSPPVRSRMRSMSALTDEHEFNPTRKLNVEEYYYLHLWGENLNDTASEAPEEGLDDTWTAEEILRLKFAPENEKEKLKLMLEKSHLQKLSDAATFFTLIKGFVCTGVLFLPNGFYNGGWLFSIFCMIFSMLLTLVCLLMLIIAQEKVGGSYSELGKMSLGTWGKLICDLTLALSQIGFVTVQTVFIYQNFNEILWFHFGFRAEHWQLGIIWFLLYSPLTWVRRIQKFAKFHVFADVAIGVTVLVIVVYTFFFYTQQGELSKDVVRINYDNYLVFFGTSIYVFEGIGIVLPVKDSVQNPERYKYILTGMMFFLVVLLIAFGLFNYLVYGAEMLKDAPLITRILPAGKYPIEGAMLLFIVNLFITFPLVIHPANMVIESYLYKGMKQSMTRKWLKNFTRTLLVAVTIVIGLWLEESLDRLMSLVGSLACTPVAFIMPAVFHLKLVAETPWVKAFDWFILIIGFVLLFFMTSNTLLTWNK